MNKKIFFCFGLALIFSIFITRASIASYRYFYSIGYNTVWDCSGPHLQVFFLIPSNATRIDKSCVVDTGYTNHGSVENWDLDLRYVGGNTNLVTLWIPKSFWFSTWYARGGYGAKLASQLVYLGVRY